MNLTFTYCTTWNNYYREHLVEGHQSDKCLFETQPHLSLMLCTLAMCMPCTACSQGACGGTAGRPVSLGTHHSSILHGDSLGLASRHWSDVLEMLGLLWFDFLIFVCLPFQLSVPRWPQLQSRPHWFVSTNTPRSHQSDPSEFCVSETLSLHWQLVLIFGQCRGFATQTQNHPVALLLSEGLDPDSLTSSVFVLNVISSEVWGLCLWCYGNIHPNFLCKSVLLLAQYWAEAEISSQTLSGMSNRVLLIIYNRGISPYAIHYHRLFCLITNFNHYLPVQEANQ